MKMFRSTACAVALISGSAAPTYAQWATPNHSVPIGRGAGIIGNGSVAPGTAGLPLVSNGPNADPSFQPVTRLQVGSTASPNNQFVVAGYQAALEVFNQLATSNYYFGVNDASSNDLWIGGGYSAGQGLNPNIVIPSGLANIGFGAGATRAQIIGLLPCTFCFTNESTDDWTGTFVREGGFGNYFTIAHFKGSGSVLQPSLQFVASNGTQASPSPIVSGNILGVLGPMGYDGSAGWPVGIDYSAEIAWYATQNWTATAHGTQTRFYYVPNNSTAITLGWTLDQDGSFYSNNVGTALVGAGTVGGTKLGAFNSGIGAATADGLVAQNSTAAAPGAQQFSPCVRLTGSGWKTAATAASQGVDWCIQNQPAQGVAAPTSNLGFGVQVNGGGFTQPAYLTSGGVFNVSTGYNINGSPLAFSNLSGALAQSQAPTGGASGQFWQTNGSGTGAWASTRSSWGGNCGTNGVPQNSTVYCPAPLSGTSQAVIAGTVMPYSGTSKNLFVQVNAAPGAGQSYTYTVNKTGTNQTVTCQIASAATTCNDTTHSFTFVAGDYLSVQVVTSATATANATHSFGLEIDNP